MVEMSRERVSGPRLIVVPLLVAVLVVFIGCGNRGQKSEGPRQPRVGASQNQPVVGQPSGKPRTEPSGTEPSPALSFQLSPDSATETNPTVSDPAFPFGKPEAGEPPPNAVPFDTVRAVALTTAKGIWKSVAEGPVIPYVNPQGSTAAYMCHFRVDGKPFPGDYWRAVKDEQEDPAARMAEGGATGRTPFTEGIRFGSVLVSARYDRQPVLKYGEGLSEYYARGEELGNIAKKALSVACPILKRVYFFGAVWFDYSGKGLDIVVPASHDVPRFLADSMDPSGWVEQRVFLSGMRQAAENARRGVGKKPRNGGKDLEEVAKETQDEARAEWDKILRQSNR